MVEGAPVALWELTCPSCEDFLRHDPLWASTVPEIPETPDETTQREDWDKRGVYDRDNVLALALARIAGVELPESMRRTVSGVAPHLPAPAITATLMCGNGHENPGAAKFCGECGTPLQQPVPAGQLPAATPVPSVDEQQPAATAPASASESASREQPSAAAKPAKKAPAAKPAAAAEHTCRTCGEPVERKGGKGRWPAQCDTCKAAS